MSAPVIDIRTQLVASIISRNGVPAGHTVGSFVDAMLTFGREMQLASVEFGTVQNGTGRLTVEVTLDGIEVREGTYDDDRAS